MKNQKDLKPGDVIHIEGRGKFEFLYFTRGPVKMARVKSLSKATRAEFEFPLYKIKNK